MSLFRSLCVATALSALACGGGQKGADQPVPPTEPEAEAPADSTEAAPAGEETPAAETAPVSSPDDELGALEVPEAPMTRGGGGSKQSGGRDYAAEQDRRCQERCLDQAGDYQNEHGADIGANHLAKCQQRCADQNKMRQDFLDCTDPPEKCREKFREEWTHQDD